jgi:hypothetical protein
MAGGFEALNYRNKFQPIESSGTRRIMTVVDDGLGLSAWGAEGSFIPALGRILASQRWPKHPTTRMRKVTWADYLMATLAVGIMIGFPVWSWISRMR